MKPEAAPAGGTLRPWPLRPHVLYAVGIFIVGLVWRLSFIYQGWAATDEGWLQAQGARIASGQVPYRDFDYVFTPLTSYKEAALIWIMGSNWTVLASRQMFSVEVSLAAVFAFLILRRFVPDRQAFFATLPAIFFTVIVLAFTSYTIDAEFMALLAVLFMVYSGDGARTHRVMGILSGVAAVLAAMSKQPFLAFLFALPIAAIAGRLLRRGSDRPLHPVVRSIQAGVPWYLVGVAVAAAVIAVYFAAEGALNQFVSEGFVLTTQAHPTTLRFKLIQDLPEYITRYDALVPALMGVVLLLLAFGASRLFDLTRSVLLGGILLYVLVITLRRPPIPSRPFMVIVAYGVLVSIGLIALLTTIVLEGPWLRHRPGAEALRARLFPPELVFLALFLQWQAQFHYDGLVFWYEGVYLSVPVVLLFVRALSGVSFPIIKSSQLRLDIRTPSFAALLLGLWIAIGGLGIVEERVYEDAARSQLTADFSTPDLKGIKAYPLTQQRMDGLVAQVEQRTQPGDPIYVIPDFSLLYQATGRRNPTRMDWPNEAFLTDQMVSRMVSDLQHDPPKLVFLPTQREGAYQRDQPPIDWANTKWAPIYNYLVAHYTQIDTVQDIRVMVPNPTP